MKSLILNIVLLVFITSCDKTNELNDVDDFMKKIISESYDHEFLPAFTPDEISKLLEYCSDNTKLKKFPFNPISSFILEDVTVGMIALWTIESIRVGKIIGNKNQFRNYGTLNPQLRHPVIENKAKLQDNAADLYKKWWNNNGLSSEEKLK